MRQRTKRMSAFLLLLALGLTACGREEAARRVDFQAAPAYTAEDVPLPVQTGDLIGCCTDGTYMYILADEKAAAEVRSVLTRVRLADGTAEIMEDYQPSNTPEDAIVNRLGPALAPDGTLWLYEIWMVSTYDLPEDFDNTKESKVKYRTSQEEFHHLRQLDPVTGRERDLVDLSEAVRTLSAEEAFAGVLPDISGFAVDGKGNIYFARSSGVAVLNRNGVHLFTLEAVIPQASLSGTSGGPLALLPDGTAAALTILPGGKREVRTIDVSAKGWGKDRYPLLPGVDALYSSSAGFLFYFVSGGTLHAWEPGAKAEQRLLDWGDTELPVNALAFAPMDGGKMAALTFFYPDRFDWYAGELRLSILLPLDKAPSDGKVKLVLGTIGTNDVQEKKVQRFNDNSSQYYIEVRNYAGEGVERQKLTDSSREAARTLFSAEVAAGRTPDIWDSSLPIDLYARKGVLEDLWPYINSDPEIDREKLFSRVLDCASVDGKLYNVFSTFSIQTAAISKELWGDRDGWTLEELLECRRKLPEDGTIFGYGVGDTGTLRELLRQDLNYWVDWSSGTCRFDSSEFKELLEVCKDEGPEIPWEERDEDKTVAALDGTDLREGRQLMVSAYMEGGMALTKYDAMFAGPERLADRLGYLYDNGLYFKRDCPFYCQALVNAEIAQVQGIQNGRPLTSKTVFGALDHGGYASYVGYPASDGSGSGVILYGTAINAHDARWGISSSCRDKEAAWSFVRQLLLPGAIETEEWVDTGIVFTDTTWCFPICREDFEWRLSPQYVTSKEAPDVYAIDKDGNLIEDSRALLLLPDGNNSLPVSMYLQVLAPSEAQMEQFWKLYNSIDHVCTEDAALLDIILEQAQPYFAGDKSLEETAKLIQNRAQLYVNENR